MNRGELLSNLTAWAHWRSLNLADPEYTDTMDPATLENERLHLEAIHTLIEEHDKLLKYCRLAVLTHDSPEMAAVKDYLLNVLKVQLRLHKDQGDEDVKE